MKDFSASIERFEDCEAVLEYVYEACAARGTTAFSYHFTPIFEAATSKNTFVWARGVPADFEQRYFAEGFRDINPVPQLASDSGPVVTASQGAEFARSDKDAARFFAFFDEIGLSNWAGFALYGPRSRNALAALTFARDPDMMEPGELSSVHTMLQMGHLRICTIMDSIEPQVVLSERERQVLRHISRGKSATEVAARLQISPETVKTYIKRIYEKLETNDRVTATVRALKLGLLEL